jgi:DNA mismatch repair ATPase MutS
MDEVKQLKDQINILNAEKIALDQSYVDEIKKSLELRKQLVIVLNELNDLKNSNKNIAVGEDKYHDSARNS